VIAVKTPLAAASIVVVTLAGAGSSLFIAGTRHDLLREVQFTDVIVHRASSQPVRLTDYLSRNGMSAVIVFSPDCASCAPEAAIWRDLSVEQRGRMTFVGLALTSDTALVAGLRTAAGLEFPVLFTDLTGVQRLGIGALPAIMVVDPAREVLFYGSGRQSTIEFQGWLNATARDNTGERARPGSYSLVTRTRSPSQWRAR
jgi:hypothetical protein